MIVREILQWKRPDTEVSSLLDRFDLFNDHGDTVLFLKEVARRKLATSGFPILEREAVLRLIDNLNAASHYRFVARVSRAQWDLLGRKLKPSFERERVLGDQEDLTHYPVFSFQDTRRDETLAFGEPENGMRRTIAHATEYRRVRAEVDLWVVRDVRESPRKYNMDYSRNGIPDYPNDLTAAVRAVRNSALYDRWEKVYSRMMPPSLPSAHFMSLALIDTISKMPVNYEHQMYHEQL